MRRWCAPNVPLRRPDYFDPVRYDVSRCHHVRHQSTGDESMALVDQLADLASQVVRIYGFEEFLKFLRPRPGVDERVAKLAAIQSDLQAAIEAVKALQKSAADSKAEAEALQATIARLQQDKQAAEDLAKVPQEAFARLLHTANARARGRGLLEGLGVGLTTGFISSFLVWYLTKS